MSIVLLSESIPIASYFANLINLIFEGILKKKCWKFNSRWYKIECASFEPNSPRSWVVSAKIQFVSYS
jgi:hypothetical protein